MPRYVLRRLLQAVVVLWGISVLIFCIARLSGNPVDLMLPMDAPRETREQLVREMGLDAPIPVQYVRFLARAVQGDFGVSIRFRQPAFRLVLERVPATAELALASLAFGVLVGVFLGVLAAVRYRRWPDIVVLGATSVGQSLPSFWVGILLILFFGVRLGWLPVSGLEGLSSLVLPALSLGLLPIVSISRLTRSSMLDVLRQDYVRTARAKGLVENAVVYRHALRNGLLPVVTLVGLQLGTLLSGAVITEQVFAWPGVGRLAVDAIYNRDYPVVQAAALVGSTFLVAINLLVDFVYTWLDPRIHLA
jgi:ABC-type dipeptide/oligopeptide/nickel transport system permease component